MALSAMSSEFVDAIGLTTFCTIALCIIAFDLRKMRIPDALSFTLLGLFIGSCVLEMPADIFGRLALSATVFVLSFVAFARRMIGGGDAKIMTALAFFVPIGALAEIALLFSATLILGTLFVILARKVLAPKPNWAFLQTSRMPMGVCIGSGAFFSPFVVL